MEKKKDKKVIVIDNWLFTKDEDGKIKVKSLNLANYLMNKYHFTFNLFDPHGFWWNSDKKQWHTYADRHLKKVNPEIL